VLEDEEQYLPSLAFPLRGRGEEREFLTGREELRTV